MSSETLPLNIETMRATIGRFLPPDAGAPAGDELAMLTTLLRGQIHLMASEVQGVAEEMPEDCIPRYVAFACVAEARGRLGRMDAAPGTHAALVYARRLARGLNALCDHYESLTSTAPR